MGSAALDLCALACGRTDAYFERGINPCDIAAGALIAQESGAVVTDLQGDFPTGDFVLAAVPGIHSALLELLLPVLPDEVAEGPAVSARTPSNPPEHLT